MNDNESSRPKSMRGRYGLMLSELRKYYSEAVWYDTRGGIKQLFARLVYDRQARDALASQVAVLTDQLAEQQRQTRYAVDCLTTANEHWDNVERKVVMLTAERDNLREGLREALERWSHANPYAYHDEPFPTDRDRSKDANRFRALRALVDEQKG